MHTVLSVLLTLLLSGPVPAGQQGAKIIELHRIKSQTDIRPRVWVRFLKRGNEGRQHSLLFDSGSHISHILSDEDGRGYVHEDATRVVGDACDLRYGTDFCAHIVSVKARVAESVEVIGINYKMSFEHEVHLTTRTDAPSMDIGLLGSGRPSSFAIRSGIFALIPPDYRDWRETSRESAGMLLVGEHDERVLSLNCAHGHPIHWISIEIRLSRIHWIVPGSVTVGVATEDVNWLIDTGAGGYYVTQAMYEAAMTAITGQGSIVGPYSFDGYTRITNCRDIESRFPTVTFRIGDSFQIEILPTEYISDISNDQMSCKCLLEMSDIRSMPSVQLIGMGVMRRTVSVFDSKHERMGFCHLRQARAPRPIPSGTGPLILPPPAPDTLHCPGGGAATWVPAFLDISEQKLSVTGVASADLGGGKSFKGKVLWILDPNYANGVRVPEKLFNDVMSLIPDISSSCPSNYLTVLPVLKFSMGASVVPVTIRISPAEYIDADGPGVTCRCSLIPVPITWAHLTVLPLGPESLRGRRVMMDRLRNRVGVCSEEHTAADALGVFSVMPLPVLESVPIALTPSTMPAGEAPTVSVAFEDQHLNLIYTLRLDTASSVPRMRFGGTDLAGRVLYSPLSPRRAAHPDEGYVDTGAVRIRTDHPTPGIMQTVEETMVLPARSGSGSPEELRFPTHMDILDPSVSRWTSANELAADRWSQFAIAAGVFALIPNWSSAEEKDRFQILVGERDEARLSEECQSGESLKWLFLRHGNDWLVAGNVGTGGILAHATRFRIASANERVQLPDRAYSDATAQIESLTGEEYVHGTDERFGIIPNCDDNLIAKLPPIRITLGGAVEAQLEGPDYVFTLDGVRGDNECYSRLLRPDAVTTGSDIYPLGFPFLKKVVTVFDNHLGRIGFCPARHPLN